MAIAYWCILIAAVLPYVWVAVAKASGERYDNREPRSWQEKQSNPRSRRASAAQLNGFESFPAFAAGVLMAQLAGVAVTAITWLSLAYVVARVLHGFFYVTDLSRARSVAWLVGIACVVALIVMAALNVA